MRRQTLPPLTVAETLSQFDCRFFTYLAVPTGNYAVAMTYQCTGLCTSQHNITAGWADTEEEAEAWATELTLERALS